MWLLRGWGRRQHWSWDSISDLRRQDGRGTEAVLEWQQVPPHWWSGVATIARQKAGGSEGARDRDEVAEHALARELDAISLRDPLRLRIKGAEKPLADGTETDHPETHVRLTAHMRGLSDR